MSRRQWLQATSGLLRVEARGAVPMALGLIVAVALLMLAARVQFEVAPEAMIQNRSYAWAVIALAAMVPLAAELFGSSSRALRASALQSLPAERSQVFVAKLTVLLVCIALAWLLIAAIDLALDQRFDRTKFKAANSQGTRLLVGTPVFALFVAALSAAAIKNALGSTLLGLVSLTLVGAAVLTSMGAPHQASTLASWGLSAAHFAVHPLVFVLALGSLAWASTLRGPASARNTRATLRRSLAVTAFALAAPVVALGATAMTTLRSASLAYDDPSAMAYTVLPSPDGHRVIVNLIGKPGRMDDRDMSSWIVDVGSGAVEQVLTPREIAAQIPFGSTNTWAGRWSVDGETVDVDVYSALPWCSSFGSVNLSDGSFEEGPYEEWSYGLLNRWPSSGSKAFYSAWDRFLAGSSSAKVGGMQATSYSYLHVPRRAAGLIFGFSAGVVTRIDGVTGEVQVLDQLPSRSDAGEHRTDPLGLWVASCRTGEEPERLSHALTGETMVVPEGWEASRSRYLDLIVRDGRVLVSRSRRPPLNDGLDWAWLEGGVLGEVLPDVDGYQMVDLDGDRMIAISHARRAVELLDREGRLLKTLRAPAAEEN